MSQIILRPVFNRPEMLQLSLKYEIVAREYYKFPYDLVTVFLIEYGSPQKTIDLVEEYPFEKKIIMRTEKFGLSKNILLGMKKAFELAGDFVIHLEDDILLHKTYFQFMDVLLNMKDIGKYSILSPYNRMNEDDVNAVYKGHHFAALAPLITKWFFMKYLIHCITLNFYENFVSRDKFVRALGEKFKNNKLYKYRNNPGVHNEWAGLCNRLGDISLIQDGAYIIMPKVPRQQHIGFYGKNRKGFLSGNNFEERLENLKKIIKSAEKLYECTGSKQYNDYLIFDNKKLDRWDGSLYIK
jgi:hypothetical protein